MQTFEELRYEAVKPILTEVGAAVYASQRLEGSIAYLLYLLARASAIEIPIAFLETILKHEGKQTAGQLIALLRKHVTVPDHAEEMLAVALDRRNTIVHRYLRENTMRMMIPKEREEMIRELKRFRAEIHEASDYFQPAIGALLIEVEGIDPELGKAQIVEEFMKHNRSEA